MPRSANGAVAAPCKLHLDLQISTGVALWLVPISGELGECIGHSPCSEEVLGKMGRRARGCGSGVSCCCDSGNWLCVLGSSCW